MNALLTVSEASDLIRSGQALAIAGDASCLDRLPAGRWIGGTIPYFMGAEGGVKSHDHVFVTQLPDGAGVEMRHYDSASLAGLVANAPDNGFTVAIVPAGSVAHARYAEDCRDYEDAFLKPTVGWIAGVDLERLGQDRARVYDGSTGRHYEDGAIAAHVALPAPLLASVEIVNIFEPDGHEVIRFEHGGFSARECLVNGERTLLTEYLAARGATHGRLPLVGDFAGAYANVSFQSVDIAGGDVHFYAPVFTDVEYQLAKPVADYAGELRRGLRPLESHRLAFSCNCILNFVYGELEGRTLGTLHGPITFGEIGHQLLNQTFVALRIE